MENLGFELVNTLGHLQGDDTVFIVQLIDIPHELAACLINDIRECKGLDDVICRYSGDYKTGMAEFVIKKRPKPQPSAVLYRDNVPYAVNSSGYAYDSLTYEEASGLAQLGALNRLDVAKDNVNYRHIVTQLCAALSVYIRKRVTAREQAEEFKSLIFDNMFDSRMFNCISSRIRMINQLKDDSRDFTKGSNCGVCPFNNRVLNKCATSDELSASLNRYLGYLTLDEFNTIVYSSKSDNSGLGLLTVRSNMFSNLTHWLDLEQFLDLNNIFM